MSNENEMQEKMKDAVEKQAAEKAAKRTKEVKGSHLLPKMKELITAAGLNMVEKTTFLQVTAEGVKGKKLYLAKQGGRVDLSGYTVQSPALTQLTKEQAQAKHIGKVQAQVNFDSDDAAILAAFELALADLKVAPPAPAPKPATEKKPRAPRKPKAEKTAEGADTAVTPDTVAEAAAEARVS